MQITLRNSTKRLIRKKTHDVLMKKRRSNLEQSDKENEVSKAFNRIESMTLLFFVYNV